MKVKEWIDPDNIKPRSPEQRWLDRQEQIACIDKLRLQVEEMRNERVKDD